MLTYQRKPECVGYILARLAVMVEAPRLRRPQCGVPMRERLERLIKMIKECGDLVGDENREGETYSKEYNWEVFGRSIGSAAALLLAILLDQRGIKTTFEGGFPYMYELYRFRYLLEDLEAFAAAGGWLEDKALADVLQARLEIAIEAGRLIKGKLEQKVKVKEEARLEAQGLFEGMLRQLFILLIRPSVAALLEEDS